MSARQIQDFNHLAFQNIMSLRFDEASRNLAKSREADPDNAYAIYLENFQQFIRCAIGGDDLSYQYYKVTSAERTGVLKDKAEPAALYFQAEINFHSFLLAMYHQENFHALRKLTLACGQLNRFLEQADNPDKGRRLKAVMMIIFSAIPDEYAWIVSLTGIKGNFGKGITMLQEDMHLHKADTAEFLESIIIITFIRNMFRQEYKVSYNNLKKLPAEYLENPLYRLVYVISASKSGHNDEVNRILQTYHQNPREYHICYFDYLSGEAMLNRLDTNAEMPLKKFIECAPSEIYLKSAYRKLAWNSLIHGDTLSFENYRKLVLESGSMLADIDRQAYHEFALPYTPNTDLIKARLLFDGGYYDQAKSLLLKKETREGLQDINQQIEYSYRLARIYHLNNETDKAIRWYRFTSENGMNLPFYYAVYSALQLGAIYEKLGDIRKARMYYHQVIEASEKSYGYRFRYIAMEGIKRLDQIVTARD